jgi:Na+-transporting methylmalonyl-CoA/oxaloacetate decarboxylase gamma subunit
MFSIFRRNRFTPETKSDNVESASVSDPALIAVIAAAIARYRAQDTAASPAVGFVVRRVRRV